MKNRDLIAILSQIDPDADVYLMTQPGYPLQHRLSGVACQKDFAEVDEGEDAADAANDAPLNGGTTNDIFLLEGSQVGYGDKRAWQVSRRA